MGHHPAGRHVLGQRASFWVAAAVVAHTLWTSAAPAISYPLYAAMWHLSPTATTGIFAVYPVAVVLTLLLFGGISDHIGRRAAMLWGVASSLLGVLLFALARDVAWVYAGRVFMGIGVGLSAGPSTAALVEYSRPGQADRASAIATAATAIGMAMAVLVGGALIAYAPCPTHLNFWVLFVVLSVLFGLVWRMPRHVRRQGVARWRPGRPVVPKDGVRAFVAAVLAVSSAYALGAIVLSLGAQIGRDLIGSSNALVQGASIALFALVSAGLTPLAKRLPYRATMAIGGVASALGMALLLAASHWQSLGLFLLAIAATGAGYTMSFLGGLTLMNATAHPSQRGGALSAMYLIGYFGMGGIAMALGLATTAWGLRVALEWGGLGIALLGLASAATTLRPPAPLAKQAVAHP